MNIGGSLPLNGLIGGLGGTTITPSTEGDSYCVGGGGGGARQMNNCCQAGFPGANGSPGLLIIYW
jgi:hypothetical protein